MREETETGNDTQFAKSTQVLSKDNLHSMHLLISLCAFNSIASSLAVSTLAL